MNTLLHFNQLLDVCDFEEHTKLVRWETRDFFEKLEEQLSDAERERYINIMYPPQRVLLSVVTNKAGFYAITTTAYHIEATSLKEAKHLAARNNSASVNILIMTTGHRLVSERMGGEWFDFPASFTIFG